MSFYANRFNALKSSGVYQLFGSRFSVMCEFKLTIELVWWFGRKFRYDMELKKKSSMKNRVSMPQLEFVWINSIEWIRKIQLPFQVYSHISFLISVRCKSQNKQLIHSLKRNCRCYHHIHSMWFFFRCETKKQHSDWTKCPIFFSMWTVFFLSHFVFGCIV